MKYAKQPPATPNDVAIIDESQPEARREFVTSHPSPPDSGFIDELELLQRLPVSRRTLFTWRYSGKIPFVNLGGRRNLYHWPSVEAALLRMQRGGGQ